MAREMLEQGRDGTARIGGDRERGTGVAGGLLGVDVDADEGRRTVREPRSLVVPVVGLSQLGADREEHVGLVHAGGDLPARHVASEQQGMVGWQHPLRIGSERGGGPQRLGQAAGFVARPERAAAEQQCRPLRFPEPLRGCCNRGGVRRGRRGRSGRHRLDAVGGKVEHVDGDFDMDRTRAGGAQGGEGPLDHRRQIIGSQQGVTERRHVADDGALIGELVQAPLPHSQLVALVDAGHHDHRHRVPVSLPHRGRDVGHPGAGDDEAGSGTSRRAGEPVGHEPRALLMARGDVTNARTREPAVQLDGVHPRNAEHVVDSVRFQERGESSAAGRHGRGAPSEGKDKLRPRAPPAASGSPASIGCRLRTLSDGLSASRAPPRHPIPRGDAHVPLTAWMLRSAGRGATVPPLRAAPR